MGRRRKKITEFWYRCPDRNNRLVTREVCMDCEKANTCTTNRVERKEIKWEYVEDA